MARAIKSGPLTPADELRELLSACEARVIRPTEGNGVPELFGWMDRIQALIPALQVTGVDLRAEQARWETVQAQVQQRGPTILAAWPPSPSLAEARDRTAPDSARWWWWLDQVVTGARRRRARRVVAVVATVAVVGVLAVVLLSRLFPVDPVAREVHRLQLAVDDALAAQDATRARQLLDQALAVAPDDASLAVAAGVAAQVTGDEARADQLWSRSRELLADDPAQFYLQRSQAFLRFGRGQETVEDAQAALKLRPDWAAAYYFLGTGYEALGDVAAAVDAYTRASELAEDEDPRLVVLARTRLASLVQQGPQLRPSPPSPTVE